jgi:hypothetical protein
MSFSSSSTNGTAAAPPAMEYERGSYPVSISCIPVVAVAPDTEDLLFSSSASPRTTTTTAAASTSSTPPPPPATATPLLDDNHQALTLLFGYEFAIIDPREPVGGEVIRQDLPQIEFNLLYHVAEAIGLLPECRGMIDAQRPIFLQQQELHEATTGTVMTTTATAGDEMPLVVRLSNLQPDEWESEIGAYDEHLLTICFSHNSHDDFAFACSKHTHSLL